MLKQKLVRGLKAVGLVASLGVGMPAWFFGAEPTLMERDAKHLTYSQWTRLGEETASPLNPRVKGGYSLPTRVARSIGYVGHAAVSFWKPTAGDEEIEKAINEGQYFNH